MPRDSKPDEPAHAQHERARSHETLWICRLERRRACRHELGLDRERRAGSLKSRTPIRRSCFGAAHSAVRRGLSAADKSRLSEAMLEAQVTAGYHRADRFHRFLEVDRDDLLVDPRFPDYATDRTDRFMVVEVIISSGRPTGSTGISGHWHGYAMRWACHGRASMPG
jgi:hypothetical protein